jgi:ATP-dependent Lon protease
VNGSLGIVRYLGRVEQNGSRTSGEAATSPPKLAWMIVEGVRWVTLEAIEQVEPYGIARVATQSVEQAEDSELAALDRKLRAVALRLVNTMPQIRDQAIAAIDGTKDTVQLADLLMAHLGSPVTDSAAYALETQVTRRIEYVIALLDAELAKTQTAPT